METTIEKGLLDEIFHWNVTGQIETQVSKFPLKKIDLNSFVSPVISQRVNPRFLRNLLVLERVSLR